MKCLNRLLQFPYFAILIGKAIILYYSLSDFNLYLTRWHSWKVHSRINHGVRLRNLLHNRQKRDDGGGF